MYMNEIWLEVDSGEKDFRIETIEGSEMKRLIVKGEIYHFREISSYRNFGKKTVKIRLFEARKV